MSHVNMPPIEERNMRLKERIECDLDILYQGHLICGSTVDKVTKRILSDVKSMNKIAWDRRNAKPKGAA